MHTYIIPRFVDSQCFAKERNQIIQEKWKQTFAILPKEFYVEDIPNVIKQLNEYSFREVPWKKTSTEEVKKYLTDAIISLDKLTQDQETMEIKEQFQRVYTQNFWTWPDKSNYTQTNDELKDKTSKEINELFSKKIYDLFFESVLEIWAYDLLKYLKLNDSLDLQKYKTTLQKSKNWKPSELTKVQKRITNEIMGKIFKSRSLEQIDWFTALFNQKLVLKASSPKKIQQNKAIACVGYSIIMTSIFQEIWIKNRVFSQKWHSGVVVEFADGRKYIVDVTEWERLVDYKLIWYDGNRDIVDMDWKWIKTIFGESNKFISWQLRFNLSQTISLKNNRNKEDFKKKVRYLQKAIQQEPTNTVYRGILAETYKVLWEKDKQKATIEEALEIDPKNEELIEERNDLDK